MYFQLGAWLVSYSYSMSKSLNEAFIILFKLTPYRGSGTYARN